MTNSRQKKQHTFNIDFYSDIDQVQYQGSFTTKKLSIADLGSIGVRKAQLNGGMYHDPDRPGHGVDFITDDFNGMIAHLEIALVATPKWWNLHSVSDADLLHMVFREVDQFENSFLNRRGQGGASEGQMGLDSENSDRNNTESNGARVVKTLVGEEVQDSFEP